MSESSADGTIAVEEQPRACGDDDVAMQRQEPDLAAHPHRETRLHHHHRRPQEPDLIVRDRHVHTFSRGGGTVTLATATFEGRLTVTDPDVLRTTLTNGIGPAKGYGCGLLTLAR